MTRIAVKKREYQCMYEYIFADIRRRVMPVTPSPLSTSQQSIWLIVLTS